MVVDFPDPLGPNKPNTSPRLISKSTLLTALAFGAAPEVLEDFSQALHGNDLIFLALDSCVVDSAASMLTILSLSISSHYRCCALYYAGWAVC